MIAKQMGDYRPHKPDRGTFYRTNSAKEILPATIDDLYLSTSSAPLFVVAPGPSLDLIPDETRDALFASPIPKFGLNKLPAMSLNFWTAYDCWANKDESWRYSPELMLDSRVMKLLPQARAHEFVPRTSIRGYQLANTFFFQHEYRDVDNLFDPQSSKIVNLRDTWPQAIDIAYRLGFRKLFLVGQDQRIRLSESQMEFCCDLGMKFNGDYLILPERGLSDKLVDVANEVKRLKSCTYDEACKMLDAAGEETHYAAGCDKGRDFATAVVIDRHYWTMVQLIRQAKPHLAKIGLELFSCTPHSRWNVTLPYLPIETVLAEYYHPFRDVLPTASLIDVEPHGAKERREKRVEYVPKSNQSQNPEDNGQPIQREPEVHRPAFAEANGLGFQVAHNKNQNQNGD